MMLFRKNVEEKLEKIIKNEKDQQPGRSGSTPLSSLANKMSKLPNDHKEKKQYESAILEIIKRIDEFNDEEISLLTFFIELSEFENQKLNWFLKNARRNQIKNMHSSIKWKAPENQFRVIGVRFRGEREAYLIKDCDTKEQALKIFESHDLRRNHPLDDIFFIFNDQGGCIKDGQDI